MLKRNWNKQKELASSVANLKLLGVASGETIEDSFEVYAKLVIPMKRYAVSNVIRLKVNGHSDCVRMAYTSVYASPVRLLPNRKNRKKRI